LHNHSQLECLFFEYREFMAHHMKLMILDESNLFLYIFYCFDNSN